MAITLKKIKNAVTYPQGFLASGLNCGIKKKKKDLALIYSKMPAKVGGVFTRNRVKAWPLQQCMRALRYGRHHAIIVNSGNANCYTGKQGKDAVNETVSFLSKELSIDKQALFVASTGVIGQPLDVSALVSSIPELVFTLSRAGGTAAAEAIMTTDTRPKQVAAECTIHGKKVRIGAMAKGVGMIKPNMATMLAFLTTDVYIGKDMLQNMVRDVVEDTFNCISVDNDMSTNDTVLVMANGLAGNGVLRKKDAAYETFKKALTAVCWECAQMMVADGEGVGRVCELTIKGAKNRAEAKAAAHAIADSMLFKTALAGGDPNWGRIIAALGAAEAVQCKFDKLNLSFGSVKIIRNGALCGFDQKKARAQFSKKTVAVLVDLKSGAHTCRFLTSDLTKKYVKINSEYTT